MDQREMMSKIEQLIEDAKTAILATAGKDGAPHMRWMTPVVVKGRPGTIFAVTSPHSPKAAQLGSHPEVEWMIQTRALDQIVNVKGKINPLDNPSIKMEVIESLGKRLTAFWKINAEKMDFIVLETIIEEATYYSPMKGKKETVKFESLEESI